MKRTILLNFLIGLLICGSAASAKNDKDYQKLASGFHRPPDTIQTSVYWYWISGNISADGVQKDLEAMKRAGINRAFIGNIGLGDLDTPYAPVKLFSEEWWQILRAALKKASELGIEIGIFNCPGWSQAGGPWIAPGQAMRYLTWSDTCITGGGRVDLTLPRPAEDFQDVRLLAFPAADPSETTLTPANAHISTSGTSGDPRWAIDNDPTTELLFDGSAEATLEVTCDTLFTLRSLTLTPIPRPIRAEAELFVEEEDRSRSLARFTIDRSNPNIEVGFASYAPVTISIPPAAGHKFRLVIHHAGQNTGIRNLHFSSVPQVERYPEKSLAKMYQSPLPYWEEYQWRIQPEPGDSSYIVRPNQVQDLSDRLHGDRLSWEAPTGQWRIMRLGMRPTGIQNSPAAPEGTGLEVDKMTPAYLQHHFDSFIGQILKRIPPEERRTFRLIVADSYEKGGQNFTDTFLEDFKARYGYDPLPWLPVYGGTVIGSQDLSDRFLWDLRRFVADRLAYSHIGGLREIAHRNGLRLWLENYGHWGFPGEFLQYGGQSDEVAGEFWSEGSLGDIENRAASSCAHIYGKQRVSAESFTASGNDFARHPARMKQRGDRFFSEGINNTLLHVYIAQPDDRVPGLNAWFGNEFNRNNTWFEHLDLFTLYLKRCNLMLQQGLNVADAAYFIGEDAPKMTGTTDPPLPKGYQFDYINAETLLERTTISDGKWTLPHGTQYRILILPKLETMRPELLERLQQLVLEGGILLGPAPKRSPSMEHYPQADNRVRHIAAQMWGTADSIGRRIIPYGKGTILCNMSLEEAFDYAACPPDCRTTNDTPVLYGHRDAGELQIYYLSNQSDKHIEFHCTLRVSGMTPEWWDPVSGSIQSLPEFSDDGQATTLPVTLEPIQSGFIVFRPTHSHTPTRSVNFPVPSHTSSLEGPWTLTFESASRGPAQPLVTSHPTDLSRASEDSVRYYSGTIRYETTFALASRPRKQRLVLNTGEIGVMAKVYVNGHYAGGLWTWPYRVDLTDFVHKGTNTLTIRLATTWVNRLIGDSMLPVNERSTWTLNNPWNPTSTLQPSGILHPVVIETYEP